MASGMETDWICKSDTVTGTYGSGTSATITNYYRWKDILLTKSLTHQDPAECEQEFTFRITKTEKDGTETPVTGNRWVVLNAYGGETGTEGTLDEDGTFTCACAGRKVKIQGLEAEQSYTVTETESGEFYRPVNDSAGAADASLQQRKRSGDHQRLTEASAGSWKNCGL